MGPKTAPMDVESLQKGGVSRGRCLDSCLVLSVVILFAALGALAAAGALMARDLQSQLREQHPEYETSKFIGGASENTYKMQNFAHLRAISSKLSNRIMQLEVIYIGAGNSIGNNYVFNSDHHSLQVKKAGSYFLYMDLNVTCGAQCPSGSFRVHFSDKLNCQVHLHNSSISQPVITKCWTVLQLSKNSELFFEMAVSKSLSHWKLEAIGSGFGIFLVD